MVTLFSENKSQPIRFDAGPTGPLLYVVAVILVYGLSMFLIVGTLARKKSENKQMDQDFHAYIKGLEIARQEAKRDQVNQTRLKWPGNFVQSFKETSENGSIASVIEVPTSEALQRKHHLSQIFPDSKQNTSEECLVLPATTVMGPDSDTNDNKSDNSEFTILPATTIVVVDEATDKSTSQIDIHNDDQDDSKLTVPRFYLPKQEHEQNDVSFIQSYYDSTNEFTLSNFSLREPTCLSTEDIYSTFKNSSNEEPKESISRIQSFSHQDIAYTENKNTQNFAFLNNVTRSHSTHITTKAADNYKQWNNKPFMGSNSSWESSKGSKNNGTVPIAHDQRKRKHLTWSNKINKSLQNSPLIKRSHKKLHDKHKGKTESADSSDDAILEEYRKSKHYRMRGKRGRRLPGENDRPVSVSSTEGSPKLPVSRTMKRREPLIGDNDTAVYVDHQRFLTQIAHVGGPLSDVSDVEDPLLEKYKSSNSYVSRTRGRKTVLY